MAEKNVIDIEAVEHVFGADDIVCAKLLVAIDVVFIDVYLPFDSQFEYEREEIHLFAYRPLGVV